MTGLPDLAFVYDPETRSIYMTIQGDDPWPISDEDARRLSIEIAKVMNAKMEHDRETPLSS